MSEEGEARRRPSEKQKDAIAGEQAYGVVFPTKGEPTIKAMVGEMTYQMKPPKKSSADDNK